MSSLFKRLSDKLLIHIVTVTHFVKDYKCIDYVTIISKSQVLLFKYWHKFHPVSFSKQQNNRPTQLMQTITSIKQLFYIFFWDFKSQTCQTSWHVLSLCITGWSQINRSISLTRHRSVDYMHVAHSTHTSILYNYLTETRVNLMQNFYFEFASKVMSPPSYWQVLVQDVIMWFLITRPRGSHGDIYCLICGMVCPPPPIVSS